MANREILFRGKTEEHGIWAEGAYCRQNEFYGDPCEYHYIISSGNDLEYNMMFYNRVLPETVGEYIGLRDCKRTEEYPEGQMIFEGDIINGCNSLHEDRLIYQVVYEENGFYYCDEDGVTWHPDHIENAIVIGNVHDNPELVKGGAE